MTVHCNNIIYRIGALSSSIYWETRTTNARVVYSRDASVQQGSPWRNTEYWGEVQFFFYYYAYARFVIITI